MNLLPWRANKLQKSIKNGYHALLFFCLILIALATPLYFTYQGLIEKNHFLLSQHEEQQLNEQNIQQKISQIFQELPQTSGKNGITAEKILKLLIIIKKIPLTEGVLNQLTYKEQTLQLQGVAMSQDEFSKVESYLRQSPWGEQIQLRQFHTTATHIAFDFTLTMEE